MKKIKAKAMQKKHNMKKDKERKIGEKIENSSKRCICE